MAESSINSSGWAGAGLLALYDIPSGASAPDFARVGDQLVQMGDNRGALLAYEKAATQTPNADIYYHLGEARERIGDWRGAVSAYNEAARLDPKFRSDAKGKSLKLLLIPEIADVEVQPHILYSDSVSPGARVALGSAWHLLDLPGNFHLDPSIRADYEAWDSEKVVGVEGGVSVLRESKETGDLAGISVGAGHKFYLTDDDSKALMPGGAYMSYGARYLFNVDNRTWYIGTGVIVEQNFEKPSKIAVRPNFILQRSF